MSKFLKYKKLFIILMAILAVITSAAAFSVSYAKWNSDTEMYADGKTGTWAELTSAYIIVFDDGSEELFGRNELTGKYLALFTVEESDSVKNFNIAGRTNGYTDIINTYEENGEVKNCIVSGENDFKYKTNGAGTYTVEINTDIKTITFTFVKPEASSYILEFNDGISAVFNKHDTENNKYTATFSILSDKSFRILKNEAVAQFADEDTALNACVTKTGVASGYTFRTAQNAGIYTVVIEGVKITFTCEQSEGDNTKDFTNAVNSPEPMKNKIGSTYGIITSNMEVIRFDTTAKRSNYFTLKSGKLFAVLINNSRINNSYYAELTLPIDGIEQDTGGKSHLFNVTREGTYYVTYDLNGSRPCNIAIKSIDRVEFAGAVQTTSDGVKKSSSSLIRAEEDGIAVYSTEFNITADSCTDFNVYINDANTPLTVSDESKAYVAENESGEYAFSLLAMGTFKVRVTDGLLEITCDGAEAPEQVASVTVSGTASVKVGSTVNLTATVTGEFGNVLNNKQVVWSVDDTSVATIENGVLTGVAEGTVNVTATSDGISSDIFSVTVIKVNMPTEQYSLKITVSQIESGKEIKDNTENIAVTVVAVSSKNTTESIVVGNETFTGRLQISSDGINFNLAENYVYTIRIVAASTGSGVRTFTLDGDTNKTDVTNGSSTEYKELSWTGVVSGQHTITVNGNARITYIEVIATPV